MRSTEIPSSTSDRRPGNETRERATRSIDCGDAATARKGSAHRDPAAGLAYAAFALARNAPKFGSSSASLGEQYQAI